LRLQQLGSPPACADESNARTWSETVFSRAVTVALSVVGPVAQPTRTIGRRETTGSSRGHTG
jgi:hypothetical protein